jgi:hypothetical protein
MSGQRNEAVWSYLGEDDCQLTVSQDRSGGLPRALVTIDEAGPDGHALAVAVPPDMMTGLTSALHEATGWPVPLILNRPDIELRALRHVAGFTISYSARDGIVIRAAGRPAGLRPGPARELAAVIAAYADASENEPDPADVRDLAEVIEGELARFTGQAREMSGAAAAAALRWMQRRDAS